MTTTRPGFIWSGTEWVAIGQEAVVAPVSYQTSAPSTPATGDIWIDSDDDVPSVDSTLFYRWTKTAAGGETSLSGSDDNSLTLKYTPGYEELFINGVLQVRGSDYVATTGTSITGLTALSASDVVMIQSTIAYSVGDTYTQAQIGSLLDAKSPVSTTGLVLLNTTPFTTQYSVAIDNIFSSNYANYKIIITNTAAATTDQLFQLVLRSGSPATDNTTSNYFYAVSYRLFSGGSFAGANATSNNMSFLAGTTGDNSVTELIINAPNLAQKTSWSGHGSGQVIAVNGGGYFNGTTQFTGFKIYSGSANMTGTIKVYGYK